MDGFKRILSILLFSSAFHSIIPAEQGAISEFSQLSNQLFDAIKESNKDHVEQCLGKAIRKNDLEALFQHISQEGESPLFTAIKIAVDHSNNPSVSKECEIVDLLLSAGADPKLALSPEKETILKILSNKAHTQAHTPTGRVAKFLQKMCSQNKNEKKINKTQESLKKKAYTISPQDRKLPETPVTRRSVSTEQMRPKPEYEYDEAPQMTYGTVTQIGDGRTDQVEEAFYEELDLYNNQTSVAHLMREIELNIKDISKIALLYDRLQQEGSSPDESPAETAFFKKINIDQYIGWYNGLEGKDFIVFDDFIRRKIRDASGRRSSSSKLGMPSPRPHSSLSTHSSSLSGSMPNLTEQHSPSTSPQARPLSSQSPAAEAFKMLFAPPNAPSNQNNASEAATENPQVIPDAVRQEMERLFQELNEIEENNE